jgi:5-methylthioadenosine/S-adenosylhomocysteine deaminase
MRRHHGLADGVPGEARLPRPAPLRRALPLCRPNEIKLLGNSRTIVTHQAVMAGNRGVNPPIPALREAGCPIAQGTDNNTQDMVSNMRMALVMERIARADDEVPGLLPQPEDMLEDAAMGGARAVNQAAQIGSLEVGKKADILVLDTQRAHLVPAGRILSAWLHNGQASDIESMMVDGRFLMREPQGADDGRGASDSRRQMPSGGACGARC